tara:strand:+ start:1865 stop:2689 length:825 start_codon:yes stop_codon:yes gene_type:complete
MTKSSTNLSFYHGGHIGDVIFSLYTIRSAGGGSVVLGPGQESMWGHAEIDALLPLLNAQSYITAARRIEGGERFKPTYDFREIGKLRNPRDFFEWDERVWPGNCMLKKRYFNGYWSDNGMSIPQQMLMYNEHAWLDAPKAPGYDIVFHSPLRKMNECRGVSDWIDILRELSVTTQARILLITGPDDKGDWPECKHYVKLVPKDLLVAAGYINSAKLFMGAASSGLTIAEGLDKFRLYDMSPEAEGADPMNARGWDTTKWSHNRMVSAAKVILNG